MQQQGCFEGSIDLQWVQWWVSFHWRGMFCAYCRISQAHKLIRVVRLIWVNLCDFWVLTENEIMFIHWLMDKQTSASYPTGIWVTPWKWSICWVTILCCSFLRINIEKQFSKLTENKITATIIFIMDIWKRTRFDFKKYDLMELLQGSVNQIFLFSWMFQLAQIQNFKTDIDTSKAFVYIF